MAGNVAVRMMARIVKVIPIERASLRQLPGVVATVAARLYAGHTVVAFPEGTTWCRRARVRTPHQGSGPFYPAMFQAAVDTGRPVQPLRLRYHHRDGRVSTVPAYIGDDTLLRSIGRLMVARRTVARIYVESLQLPGDDRRELARRCQAAIRITAAPHPGHGQRRPCWRPDLSRGARYPGQVMVYLDHAATSPMHPAAVEAMTAVAEHRR